MDGAVRRRRPTESLSDSGAVSPIGEPKLLVSSSFKKTGQKADQDDPLSTPGMIMFFAFLHRIADRSMRSLSKLP